MFWGHRLLKAIKVEINNLSNVSKKGKDMEGYCVVTWENKIIFLAGFGLQMRGDSVCQGKRKGCYSNEMITYEKFKRRYSISYRCSVGE